LGDVEAALDEEILDVSGAECEAQVDPDSVRMRFNVAVYGDTRVQRRLQRQAANKAT